MSLISWALLTWIALNPVMLVYNFITVKLYEGSLNLIFIVEFWLNIIRWSAWIFRWLFFHFMQLRLAWLFLRTTRYESKANFYFWKNPVFFFIFIVFILYRPFFEWQNVQTKSFKNPFDIPREKLIEQLRRMRLNFFHSSSTNSKFEDEGKLCSYLIFSF